VIMPFKIQFPAKRVEEMVINIEKKINLIK
jgi:hypothetical protein